MEPLPPVIVASCVVVIIAAVLIIVSVHINQAMIAALEEEKRHWRWIKCFMFLVFVAVALLSFFLVRRRFAEEPPLMISTPLAIIAARVATNLFVFAASFIFLKVLFARTGGGGGGGGGGARAPEASPRIRRKRSLLPCGTRLEADDPEDDEQAERPSVSSAVGGTNEEEETTTTATDGSVKTAASMGSNTLRKRGRRKVAAIRRVGDAKMKKRREKKQKAKATTEGERLPRPPRPPRRRRRTSTLVTVNIPNKEEEEDSVSRPSGQSPPVGADDDCDVAPAAAAAIPAEFRLQAGPGFNKDAYTVTPVCPGPCGMVASLPEPGDYLLEGQLTLSPIFGGGAPPHPPLLPAPLKEHEEEPEHHGREKEPTIRRSHSSSHGKKKADKRKGKGSGGKETTTTELSPSSSAMMPSSGGSKYTSGDDYPKRDRSSKDSKKIVNEYIESQDRAASPEFSQFGERRSVCSGAMQHVDFERSAHQQQDAEEGAQGKPPAQCYCCPAHHKPVRQVGPDGRRDPPDGGAGSPGPDRCFCCPTHHQLPRKGVQCQESPKQNPGYQERRNRPQALYVAPDSVPLWKGLLQPGGSDDADDDDDDNASVKTSYGDTHAESYMRAGYRAEAPGLISHTSSS